MQNKKILKEVELNVNRKKEGRMSLKKEWEKRNTESKAVLIIAIIFILYLSNASQKIIITGLPNFWFSIIASVILVIIWLLFTKE